MVTINIKDDSQILVFDSTVLEVFSPSDDGGYRVHVGISKALRLQRVARGIIMN
jgi:hypothetical protein